MTIESSTAAQRITLRDTLAIAKVAAQKFAQDSVTPTVAQAAVFDPLVVAASTAIAAAGYSPSLPATQVVVANGGTVNVENSAGALDSPATAVVAGGVLTGVNLASTKTILTNALKFSGVTITGSGTFFTPTITNGVLTGGVLSAS